MNISVIKSPQFNSEQLKFKKKISMNKVYSIIPIQYNDRPLIIQTPMLYIPFSKSNYNTIDISLTNTEDNSDITMFETVIKTIMDKAIRKYKRPFVNPLLKDSYYPARLRVNITKSIMCFDYQKKYIGTNIEISPKSYARFIIEIKELWAKKTKYGININLLQLQYFKRDTIKLEKYSFIDSDDEAEVETPSDINIDKYQKMKKNGVPVQAIQNKMVLDGIDPSLLFKPVSVSPVPVSPVSVLPPPNMMFLGQIKSGSFGLKKTERNKSPKIIKKNNAFNININELQNILSNLKKSKKKNNVYYN